MKLPPNYALVLSLITLQVWMSIVADYFLKSKMFVPGMVIYALCAIPAFFMFRMALFGTAWVLWSVVGVVCGVGTALVYYHEPLTLGKGLAVICAIAAIILSGGK